MMQRYTCSLWTFISGQYFLVILVACLLDKLLKRWEARCSALTFLQFEIWKNCECEIDESGVFNLKTGVKKSWVINIASIQCKPCESGRACLHTGVPVQLHFAKIGKVRINRQSSTATSDYRWKESIPVSLALKVTHITKEPSCGA